MTLKTKVNSAISYIEKGNRKRAGGGEKLTESLSFGF